MDNRLRNAVRLLGVLLLCGATAFLAGAAVPNRSVRLGNAVAETSPHDQTSLNIALTGTASASTEASGSPASNAIDGSASTDWCSTQWTGSLTVDLGRVRSLDGLRRDARRHDHHGARQPQLRHHRRFADAGPGRPAAVGSRGTAGLLAGGPRADQSPLRDDRRDRQRRDAAVHRRAPPVRARPAARSPTVAPICRSSRRRRRPERTSPTAACPASALSILNAHGLNYVRLRLWVNPPAGYSDLASDLRMARRIKAAGDKLYLDIHYSDFWADPTHQDIPAAWQGQDLSQLTTTVQNYTAQVIGAFAAQGTPVDMVSIGNEIRNGILWPVGEVDWSTDTGWDNLTTLLKAGVAGRARPTRAVTSCS